MLDLNFIRSQFPALSSGAIFLDNPGGTQVAQQTLTEGLVARVIAESNGIGLVFHRPTREYLHRARLADGQRVVDRFPACGANVSGRFCSSCGSSLTGAAACASCRQPLPAGARFCRHCGASAVGGAPAAAGQDRLPWLIAGASAIALLGLLIAFLAKNEKAAPAEKAPVATARPGGGEAMPSAADLAAMSPKERFDRLYNRVMRAAEAGDQATVEQFSPMARMAYAQLDTV